MTERSDDCSGGFSQAHARDRSQTRNQTSTRHRQWLKASNNSTSQTNGSSRGNNSQPEAGNLPATLRDALADTRRRAFRSRRPADGYEYMPSYRTVAARWPVGCSSYLRLLVRSTGVCASGLQSLLRAASTCRTPRFSRACVCA